MATPSRFGLNALLMLLATGLIVAVIYGSEIPHLGLFITLVVSFVGGWLEPRRGWLLALGQVVIVVGFYWLNESGRWLTPADAESALFVSHVSIFTTLVGSFLGGFVKRL